MKSLDAFTVVFMAAFVCVGMSIVMFSVQRSLRNEVHGLGHWAWGQLAMVLAAILTCLRGTAPDVFTVPLSNAALLWGIGLSVAATRVFYGRPPRWLQLNAIWMGCVAGLVWWLVVHPDFVARVALFSMAEVVYHLMQLQVVARHGERHFSTWFFGTLLIIQIGLVSVRGATAVLYGAPSAELHQSTTLAASYLAISDFVVILLSVAFIVLAARRVQGILEQRASQDPLTGVLNRRGFYALSERMRARGKMTDWPVSLLVIDIDHFKSVNDRFGHAVGDQILVRVATLVRQAVREQDAVVRFGGEEFVVMLTGTPLALGRQVAERIQALLANEVDDLPICTVSIGLAWQATANEPIDALMNRADSALYRAKNAGRNCIVLADHGA